MPVILSTEVTVVREDEFGEDHVLSIALTGAVWKDGDVVEVRLRTAQDDQEGRFVASPSDLSWSERTWAEDSLEGVWEDLGA